jgi:predicted chitinase
MDENNQELRESMMRLAELMGNNNLLLENQARMMMLGMKQEDIDKLRLEQVFGRNSGAVGENTVAVDRSSRAYKANVEAAEEYKKAMDNYASALKGGADGLKKVFNSLISQDPSRSMAKYSDGLSTLGDAAAKAAENFGPLGKAVGATIQGFTKLAGAQMQQVDLLLKANDQLAQFGTAGSFTTKELMDMAHGAGVTSKNMDTLINPIKSLGPALTSLGGTASDGVKAFAAMTKVTNQQREEFQRLGVSQEQLIQNQADYVKLQMMSGKSMTNEIKDRAALQRASLEYTENLLTLSNLSGQDAESIKKKQQDSARAVEAQVAQIQLESKARRLEAEGRREEAALVRKDAEGRKKSIEMLAATGDEGAMKGVREFLSTGTLVSEEAQALSRLGLVDELKNLKAEIAAGGDAQKATAKFQDAYNKALISNVDKIGFAASRSADVAKAYNITESSLENANKQRDRNLATELDTSRKKIEDAKKPGQDPAQDARAKLTTLEIEAGKAIDKLVGSINPLLGGFNALTVGGTVAAAALMGLAGAAGSKLVSGIAAKGADAVKSALGMGAKIAAPVATTVAAGAPAAAASVAAPAAATAVGAAGGAGTAASAATAAGTALSKLAAPLAGIAKNAPLIGSALSLGTGAISAYQGVKQANKDVEEGNISRQEGSIKKGEAVGGGVGIAAGGAGGALGGAAAGAAIGSIVPVVGTVIGGILGAAVGGWLGSKGGELIGEKVGAEAGKKLADTPQEIAKADLKTAEAAREKAELNLKRAEEVKKKAEQSGDEEFKKAAEATRKKAEEDLKAADAAKKKAEQDIKSADSAKKKSIEEAEAAKKKEAAEKKVAEELKKLEQGPSFLDKMFGSKSNKESINKPVAVAKTPKQPTATATQPVSESSDEISSKKKELDIAMRRGKTDDVKRLNRELGQLESEQMRSNITSAPKAAVGGIFEGPKSGYPVELHGKEMVTPLGTGMKTASLSNMTDERDEELEKEIEALQKLKDSLRESETMFTKLTGSLMKLNKIEEDKIEEHENEVNAIKEAQDKLKNVFRGAEIDLSKFSGRLKVITDTKGASSEGAPSAPPSEGSSSSSGTGLKPPSAPPMAGMGGGTGITPPPVKQDVKQNLGDVKAAMMKRGMGDEKYLNAVLGNVMKESGGKIQNENLNYSKTSNERIRSIFGSRARGKSEQELNDIKSSPESMGEFMYGKDTKIGRGMGNLEPGDGFKYRGRGYIQLTGKSNYAAASQAIFGDDTLVKNPDLVNDPKIAADVVAWYMERGKAGMANKMGIDDKNMTQDQANLLATSQIAGTDVRRAGGYLGGEVMNKVAGYAASKDIQDIKPTEGGTMVASADTKKSDIPKAQKGGVFEGPETGYIVELHGNETVIPTDKIESLAKKELASFSKMAGNVTTGGDTNEIPAIDTTAIAKKSVKLFSEEMGPTFAGMNEYTGYNAGPMSTDLKAVQGMASKVGAYDDKTQTITDTEAWKKILHSGIATNYDMGLAKVGTEQFGPDAGNVLGDRLKEIMDMDKTSLTDAIKQLQEEFRSATQQMVKDLAQNAAAPIVEGADENVMAEVARSMTELVNKMSESNDIQGKILQYSQV